MTTRRADESSVVERSAGLKRELGLTDLVLTQILFIVGLPWVGVAAKQGPAHVVFWLVALAIVPIVQVESRLLFAVKLSALIIVTNIIGLAIFLGKRTTG